MSKRRADKHRHVLSAWIAILALLIDALLPTAVSAAAAVPGASAPVVALCGAAETPPPAKHDRSLPVRHCALCAAVILGLSPGPSGLPIERRLAGVLLSFVPSPERQSQRPNRNDVQPRAPPHLG